MTDAPCRSDALLPTLDGAAAQVRRLVDDFEASLAYYFSAGYQEAEVRRDFIDKFLVALGWDVNHEVQRNPFEQEVKVERVVHTATAQRKADYALSVAPHYDAPVLYIEAKKPTTDLECADNCFQIIRYANQREHPIGVLTDFARILIVDCRFKANIDTAASRVLREYHVHDLRTETTFAEVFYLLSRPAVRDGALIRFSAKLPKPKGRPGQKSFVPIAHKPLDERLLDTLDEAREALAKALKNANSRLDSDSLTELTQRIIDRLVFIRFLEDKLIEPEPIIPRLGESTDRTAWQDFLEASRRLDRIYNGIVFKYHTVLDAPDGLKIDEKAFADILDEFDYYHSEYLFNHIPIHILGSIYERFLGNVIVATSRRAALKPKPEVRKAGGVYYTPKYIVDYIVENVVGPALEGKSPRELVGLKFADIACGSGSFLLGLYERVLRHVAKWYNDHPAKAPKGAVLRRDGVLYLTLDEKARLLVATIYGVDIDPQAVEVAQLSLYLKLLEEETTATARQFTLNFHRPLLPSLSDNVKCGNSIIDSRFYDDRLTLFDDPSLVRRVNPFDWRREYSEVMERGGFDAIVGNPPYVNAWELFANIPEVREYINSDRAYQTADRHWDLYVVFIERALSLLRPGGRLCYIIPYSYAIQKYGIKSRKRLLAETTVESVADLRSVRVFGKVPVITIIPSVRKIAPGREHKIQVRMPGVQATARHAGEIRDSHTVSQTMLLGLNEHMLRLDLDDCVSELCRRVDEASVPLGSICFVNYGAQMSSRNKGEFGKDYVLRDHKDTATCQRTVAGRDLYRYRATWNGKWVEWALANRMYGSREPWFFETPKLMIRDITGTHRLEVTLDESKLYCDHTILCALRACDISACRELPGTMVETSHDFSRELLLGLVASRLVSAYYYWRLTGEGVRTGGGFHTYPKTIRALPMFAIRNAGSRERAICEEIEDLARKLQTLYGADDALTEHASTMAGRQRDAVDRKIDDLVFRLYGLSEKEIELVEQATR